MRHEVFLDQYRAKCKQIGPLVLGTEGSYGNETLKIETSSFWDGLTITAIFNVDTPVKMLVSDGVVSVPQEATAKAGKFTVTFLGVANGIRRISEDLEYIVLQHSDIDAQDPTQPTPNIWEQFVQDVKSAATTFVPSVSQDGVISWTNNGDLPNPEPVYIGGKKGDKGDAPNIQIGTVTTLEPDEQATVERIGTDENPIFNFGIPRGKDGINGSSSSIETTTIELLMELKVEQEDVISVENDIDLESGMYIVTGKLYRNPTTINVYFSIGEEIGLFKNNLNLAYCASITNLDKSFTTCFLYNKENQTVFIISNLTYAGSLNNAPYNAQIKKLPVKKIGFFSNEMKPLSLNSYLQLYRVRGI